MEGFSTLLEGTEPHQKQRNCFV